MGQVMRFSSHAESLAIRHDFFSASSPDADWLAGLLAADGCISRSTKYWLLAQSGDIGKRTLLHVRALINHGLTLGSTMPPGGNISYCIYVPSALMVKDLKTRYGIGPGKTYVYAGPIDQSISQRCFLRGYIDGDGCVNSYFNSRGSLYMHISFVGTETFMEWARSALPASCKPKRIKRCKNLFEIRFNGETACLVGDWLYADADLFSSDKRARFVAYRSSARPRWLVGAERRHRVMECLREGKSLRQTAAETGVHVGTICVWKKEAKSA